MGFSPSAWLSTLTTLRVKSLNDAADRGVCPLCRKGQIAFYQDSHLPLQRYACNQCDSAGDFLDLVSQLRSVPRNLALMELQAINAELGTWYSDYNTRSEQNRKIADTANAAWKTFRGEPPRAIYHGSAVHLLNSLGVTIRPSLGWTETVISQAIGYASSDEFEDWLRLKDPDARQKRLAEHMRRHIPSEAVGGLVFPIRVTPDVIEGFQVCFMLRHKWRSIVAKFPYVGDNCGGLIGHPDVLIGSGPVIVFEDYRLAARCQFNWLINHTQPCPVVAMADDEAMGAENLQLLAGRDVIFWSPRSTPDSYRRAATLDAKVSSLASESVDLREWLGRQDIDHLLQRIRKTAAHWSTAVAHRLKGLPPQQAANAVTLARLSSVEIRQVVSKLDDGEVAHSLSQHLQPDWPYKRLAAKRGNIEQRADGWWHLVGRSECLITDAPYRIVQVESDQEGTFWYQVETKFRGQVHSLRLKRSAMTRSPMESIQSALLEKGVGLSTFDRDWESQAGFLAQRFHDGAKVDVPQQLGVDAASARLYLSNVSFCLRTGQARREKYTSIGQLLPQAFGRSLSPVRVQSLVDDPFSSQAMLAYLYQLVASVTACESPLVSLTTPLQAKLGRAVLTHFGLPTSDIELVRTQYPAMLPKSLNSRKELSSDCLWISCDEKTSWYYGGLRPLIILPEESQHLADADILQETALAVLAIYMRSYRIDHPGRKGIDLAWNQCIEKLGCKAEPASKSVEVVGADKSLLNIINESLATDLWQVLPSAPAKPENNQVWLDKEKSWLTFTSSSINTSLAEWGLPRWDLIQVMASLWNTSLFKETTKVGTRSCWQIKTTHIDLVTRKNLRVRRKEA